MASSKSSVKSSKSLKNNNAGYSTTNRKGVTTYYKSSKDAAGYSDTANGKGVKTSAGNPIGQRDAQGAVITAGQIGNTGKPNLPGAPAPSDPGNMTGANNAGLASLVSGTHTYQNGQFVANPADSATTNAVNESIQQKAGIMQQILGLKQQNALPDNEKIYRDVLKEEGYKQKQQEVNNHMATLNGITAKQEADLLRVRGVGSDNGGTEAVYGGQQATINREAAIAALPVQAQLAAAQGNLELAQNHVDTMFKLKSADATAQYNYKNNLIDSVMQFANSAQESRLQAKLADIKDEKQKKDEFLKAQRDALSQAYAQGAPASVTSAISGATDINGVIRGAGAYNGDVLARQIKQKQLASLGSASTPDVKNFGTSDKPEWKQYDATTKSWTSVPGVGGQAKTTDYTGKLSSINSDISRATQLLSNDAGIRGSSGNYQPGFVGNFFTGSSGITPEDGAIANLLKFTPVLGNISNANVTTNKKNDFLSGIGYIINNQTFDKLKELKQGGATFGALSDSERVAIGRAASDLASSVTVDESGNVTGFRGSEKNLRTNLAKVLEGYKAQRDQLNIENGFPPEEVSTSYSYWNQLPVYSVNGK